MTWPRPVRALAHGPQELAIPESKPGADGLLRPRARRHAGGAVLPDDTLSGTPFTAEDRGTSAGAIRRSLFKPVPLTQAIERLGFVRADPDAARLRGAQT